MARGAKGRSHEPPPGEGSSWASWWAVGLVLAAGAAARVGGIFNDLSLDEVWSIRDVLKLNSLLEIFTSLTHDNNHPLNSLFIRVLGDQAGFHLYRLLSLATGIATPWLIYLFARRYGRKAAFASLFLGSLSFLLVEYASEARGYSPAIFLVFASVLLAERALESGRWRDHLLFWVSAILGILSHSTFLFALGGILAGSMVRVWGRRTSLSGAAGRFLKLALLPAVAIFAFLIWWKDLFIEGGPAFDLGRVLSDLTAFTFGLPLGWKGMAVAGAAAAAVLLRETAISLREETDVGVFFLFSIFLCPAGMLLIHQPEFLYPRYFLVCVSIALVLWGRFLGRLAGKGRWREGLAFLLVVLYAAGNLVQIVGLLKVGRGQFRAALEYMASHSGTNIITVTSDQDFRNEMLLTFHARGFDREVRFIKIEEQPSGPPAEWYIVHTLDPRDPLNPRIGQVGDTIYRLEAKFPSQPPSGITWYIYHRLK